jgi:deoxyadenosine/deoxycytidine kinase
MLKGGEPIVIIIEGQIGVGKTTMGEILEEQLDVRLYRELQRQETLSLLDRFYADQRRWAFTLQIHFLNERFRMIKQIRDAGGGALDRSIYGDRIFADVLHSDGQMNDEEYVTYTTLLENMLEHVRPPDLLIYLDCAVDTAMDRIKKRNRGLESGIPREYLVRLNNRYLEFYRAYDASSKILIDTDSRPLDVHANVAPILEEIRAELEAPSRS